MNPFLTPSNIVGHTPTAHFLIHNFANDTDVKLTTVSSLLSSKYNWKTHDGKEGSTEINNGAWPTLGEFITLYTGLSSVSFDLVFVTLTSIHLMENILKHIKPFLSTKSLILVDATIGILLENTVRLSLPDRLCISTFLSGADLILVHKDNCLLVDLSTCSFELGHTGTHTVPNFDMAYRNLSSHSLVFQVQKLLSSRGISVVTHVKSRRKGAENLLDKVWNHQIEVCFDLLSFVLGRPNYLMFIHPDEHLQIEKEETKSTESGKFTDPKIYIFRNILNDLVSLLTLVSGTGAIACISADSEDVLNCKVVTTWARRRLEDPRTYFLDRQGTYVLLLVYQLILLSDTVSLQSSTLEFLYAQLFTSLLPSIRATAIPSTHEQSDHPAEGDHPRETMPTGISTEGLDLYKHTFELIDDYARGWYHFVKRRRFVTFEKEFLNSDPGLGPRKDSGPILELLLDQSNPGIDSQREDFNMAVENLAITDTPEDVDLLPLLGDSCHLQPSDGRDNDPKTDSGHGDDDDCVSETKPDGTDLMARLLFLNQVESLPTATAELPPDIDHNPPESTPNESRDIAPVAVIREVDQVPVVDADLGNDENMIPHVEKKDTLMENHQTIPNNRTFEMLVNGYSEDERAVCSKRNIYLRRGSHWFSEELYNVDVDESMFQVPKQEDVLKSRESSLLNYRYPKIEGPSTQRRSPVKPRYKAKKNERILNGKKVTPRTQAEIWTASFLQSVNSGQDILLRSDKYGDFNGPNNIPSMFSLSQVTGI